MNRHKIQWGATEGKMIQPQHIYTHIAKQNE